MRRPKYPSQLWADAEAEYVTNVGATYRQISDRFGISEPHLTRFAIANNWREKRQMANPKKTAKILSEIRSIVEKPSNELTDDSADEKVKMAVYSLIFDAYRRAKGIDEKGAPTKKPTGQEFNALTNSISKLYVTARLARNESTENVSVKVESEREAQIRAMWEVMTIDERREFLRRSREKLADSTHEIS